MMFRLLFLLMAVSLSIPGFAASPAEQAERILGRCRMCHSGSVQQGGLRLDSRESLLKGGASGAAVVPGKASESLLLKRVTGSGGQRLMPPAGDPLSATEIAALERWIDSGAAWPESSEPDAGSAGHWAFRPIRKAVVPSGEPHPVDAFVRAKLQKEGVTPAAEAPKAVQLRRLSLDLTGLPPTPDELTEFLADTSPQAWERQVDRLLASPHHGEKWARHWLDLARYGDSDGYEKDWVRPWAWRYRQWVIDSVNRDLPFDQFTLLQIAGDLLPRASTDALVATGFHRQTLTNREGGVDNAQFEFENTVDRASTVATAWLGLTMGCAQCHDHKFDPVSQKDFYRFFAFFDNLEEIQIDAPMPGETGPYLRSREEYLQKRRALIEKYGAPELQASWEKEMLHTAEHPGERTDWDLVWDCLLKLTEGGDGEKIISIPAKQRTKREREILTTHFIRNYHFAVGTKVANDQLKLNELDRELRKLEAEYPQLSQAMVVKQRDKPRETHLRLRGDYKALGPAVTPGAPGSLPALDDSKPDRLDLARWLTSEDNPLTARVTVNRIWQEYFGRGLVRTSEDFGTQGETPAHPKLLDYLAARFQEDGWSLKRLHKLIVTSKTYRQSSDARPEIDARDPENELLARQSRLRLPAESIRDAALGVADLLDPKIGGPSIKPPQPAGVTELGYAKGTQWEASEGSDRYRRGLYIHFQRTTPYPLLINFDAPKGTVAVCRRQRSNTPLQALNLLNDPVFVEAAQALGRRMRAAGGADKAVRRGYSLALGREPSTRELGRLIQYLKVETERAGEDAAWTGVASVLLNLDEFITRE